jgi:hypothetical protein
MGLSKNPLARARVRLAAAMVAGVAAVAVAGTLAAAGGAAAAAVPTAGASAAASAAWPSQVAHPAAVSCPSGSTLVAPSSGWTDALGVAHFSYKAVPGLTASVPPRGLTAGRVTKAMLTDIGLPAGAAGAAGARGGHSAVQQALNLGQHQTAPAFCRSKAQPNEVLPKRSSGPVTSAASGTRYTHVYRGNWGGYALTEAENGGAIEAAYGSWTQGGSHTSSSPSASATWVGIGGGLGEGSGTVGLIQAGTSMQTDEGYRSWFEYISNSCTSGPCAPHFSGTDDVRPGDSLTSDVWWASSTEACFDFTDWTTSAASIFTCVSNIPIVFDHTSAEWINENLLAEGYQYYDNPGTTDWTDQAFADNPSTGSYLSPFSKPYEAVVMAIDGGSPSPSCGHTGVLSVPVNAGGSSTVGSSQEQTCVISGIDSP